MEGTPVSTEAGQIPIEAVVPGMLVWATDPVTGETALKSVVQTFVNYTDELVHVTVNGETITCTNEHPFYSPQRGWLAACQLRAGDVLVMLNGEYVVVEQVQHELLESPVAVYNFEVEGFHTYYVGDTEVLVHNDCKPSGSYEIFTADDRVYVGKGDYSRMQVSIRRLEKEGFTIVDHHWDPAPNSDIGFVYEYMKMAKYNFDFEGKMINKIMSPGFKKFNQWL